MNLPGVHLEETILLTLIEICLTQLTRRIINQSRANNGQAMLSLSKTSLRTLSITGTTTLISLYISKPIARAVDTIITTLKIVEMQVA